MGELEKERKRYRAKVGALEAELALMRIGGFRSNYPCLKKYCDMLYTMLTQKTAGQKPYAKRGDIDFDDLDGVINGIVIEAMALVASGDYEQAAAQVEKRYAAQED